MKKSINKYFVIFFSILSILSIFFYNNNVYAFGEKFIEFSLGTFGKIFSFLGISQTAISDGKAVNTEYDSRVALFDGLENNIPRCDDDYYVGDGGIFTAHVSGTTSICSKNTQPDIKKIVDHLPYILRVDIKLKDTDISYPIFYFFKDVPTIVNKHSDSHLGFSEIPYFTINFIPNDDSDFYTKVSSKKYYGYYNNNIYYYNVNMYGYNNDEFYYNKSFATSGVGDLNSIGYSSTNEYFDFTYSVNFDLYDNSNTLLINKTDEHVFDTDTDIAIPKDYYLYLLPKKREEYSSYFYTDNNFAYTFDYYDKLANTYSSIDCGALTQINFGSMGGFNWFRWDVNYLDADITFNKTIRIFNPNEQTLNIKFNSSDFYYSLSTKGSPDFCVDDLNICFKNNYDDLNSFAHSFEYKNIYDNGDYDSGISFIKSISNLVKDFSKAFSFIGLIFTSFFSIFNGPIANYFYIVFGLAIIILILKVLK